MPPFPRLHYDDAVKLIASSQVGDGGNSTVVLSSTTSSISASVIASRAA